MPAVNFFDAFGYKWGQAGTAFNWDDAQYKLGWSTVGSVPPSVEQFNRIHQVADEKANYLFEQIKKAVTDAELTMSAGSTDTLSKAIRALSLPIYATAPATNVGPLVYVIDRQQILHWQTVGTFTGYVSPDVGRFIWGTSATARPDEVDLIGQTVDRTNARFRALIAWAEANSHMVASGSWAAGAFRFSVISGNNVRLPDLRNQFIRATGTDADTANARSLGSGQADAFRSHDHAGIRWGAWDPNGGATGTGSPSTSILITSSGNNPVGSVASNGGAETRPPNTAFHPRIQI